MQKNSDIFTPADASTKKGNTLAIWQAGIRGSRWIRDLTESGDAIDIANNQGYPNKYTVQAGKVISIIEAGPPNAKPQWISGEGDLVPQGMYERANRFHCDAMAACDPSEWLIVELWDES